MALIRDVINSIDTSTDLGPSQRKALDTLATLGAARADSFGDELAAWLTDGDERSVPVLGVVSRLADVRAYTAADAGKIGRVVDMKLRELVSGTAVTSLNCISTLTARLLRDFLADTGAHSGTRSAFFIGTEHAALVRIDVKAWYQDVTDPALRPRAERVVAVAVVKSLVDVAGIDVSRFAMIYGNQLRACDVPLEDVRAAMETVQSIYGQTRLARAC